MEEEVLKDVMNSIVDKRNKELYAIKTREELQSKYFQFDFDKEYDNPVQRLRDFVDAIAMLKHFARDWESKVNGFTCCVDRVYQYFVNPLCKKFEDTRR